MADFGKLISGYRVFKATKYNEQKDIIGHLIRQGVKPKTLFITCSDLRVSPDVMLSSNPGDLFVVRNLAALVPPFGTLSANGVVATIEYAVLKLNVENIVVMGHAHCDAIKTMMSDASTDTLPAMKDWFNIGNEAKEAVKKQLAKESLEDQEKACEFESVLVSIKHLISYPFISERINNDSLKIYGWHFTIDTGTLVGFNPETKYFDPIG